MIDACALGIGAYIDPYALGIGVYHRPLYSAYCVSTQNQYYYYET